MSEPTGIVGRRGLVVLGLLGAAALASAIATDLAPGRLLGASGRAGIAAFVDGMFPPDLSRPYVLTIARAAAQTLAVSVSSMLVAVVVGLTLGVAAVDPRLHGGVLGGTRSGARARLRRLVYTVSRLGLAVTRSIPELFWALLFIVALGLGPFPGVLALGVHAGGVLGKLYAELIETLDPRPLEALRAAGASRLTVLAYGALPQLLPSGLSYTLYRWEISIREATVLGFVGAGGLGYELYLRLSLFQHDKLATLLLAIFVLVLIVDGLSAWVRRLTL